jgi:UDP-N-acetylglucosamine 2-epimerase (non-hydrolysing)/GDP/UDP-N,N'-diacetylbacillosamine 2-epimerase (hydrolysing)
VDDLTLAAREKRDDFLPRIGLPRAGYAVFIFHPTTSTEFARAGSQARASLEALEKTGLNVVGIYPNNDAGGEAIIRELRRWAKRPGFWVFRNLPRRDYLNLLRHAEVMVGNSSSGFIDTATFRLPVVNVGSRQSGRERSTNVIDAAATKASVARALRRALAPSFRRRLTRCRNPYGSGCPGAKIAGVLARVALGPALIQKQIRY